MLYVNADDFNASDLISNNGNSPTRPFKTVQRALLEVARFSYVQGQNNDKYDQFTINLAPGDYIIDNRPGKANTAEVPELSDQSNFDILDPNNDLYKFNSTSGGLVIPRGTSLVGMDLRKTRIRPRYVPEPTDGSVDRTSIFKVTGACYFWQFSLFDALPTSSSTGLGGVYNRPDNTTIVNSNYSHHKVTCFTYSDQTDLDLFYAKSARAFASIPTTAGELESRVQETRIVGPLQQAGQKGISSIVISGSIATVITNGPHEVFEGQQITIEDVTGAYNGLNGTYYITGVDNDTQFRIIATGFAAGSVPSADLTNAIVKAEIDTVDSSSPYIFNCSLRSTYGLCGLWADGDKVSGFKSMVVAQFTGVSLQKDDRAFVKFSEQTTPEPSFVLEGGASDSIALHQDSAGYVYYRGDATTGWRHYHIRVSNNAFIQSVSVFAVGYAEQHLIENGGDYSITNSNSNFGTQALIADGFRPDAFTLDKKGYISHIVPPQALATQETEVPYYPLDVQKSRSGLSPDSTGSKLYLFEQSDPNETPVFDINFFKVGGKVGDKIYANLTDPVTSRINEYEASLDPSGIEEHNITQVDRSTDTFTTQGTNNFETGTPIRIYSNTGYLPLGMESNRLYYAIKLTNTSFKIAPSEEDSRAGAGGNVSSIVNIRSGIPANASLSVRAYVSDTNPELPRFDVSVNANLEQFNTGTFAHGFTTGDKVFFQRRIIAGVVQSGQLPLVQTGGVQQSLSLTTEYYAIVVDSSTFKIADTESNANNDIPIPIDTNGDASVLTVYRNIQKSPLRFDPEQDGWYLSVKPDISNTIHPIFTSSNTNNIYSNITLANTENAYMKRIDDNRANANRTYRLRYVIPKTQLNARPPITGYVIRRKTDASNVIIPYDTQGLTGQTAEFDRVYFIYRIDTILTHIPGEQDGVYYLTVLLADVSPKGSQFNSPTDTFGFLGYSQDVGKIYPDLDKDNPLADPKAAVTVADNLVHGLVYQDNDRSSITKEAAEAFVADCGYSPTLTALTGKATSGQENRLIGFDATGNVTIEIELRRTSQVRAGNQTFEYTGFGSGNYSTGFPSKQERVLSDKEVLYSQAQRRRAGVVFYSGLNAYGDLYVGNQKINAVTGEVEILDKPILRVAGSSAEVGNEEYVPYVQGTKNVNIEGTLVTGGGASKTPNNFNNETIFSEGIKVATKEPSTINRALTTHDVNYRPKGIALEASFTNGTVKQTVLSQSNLRPTPGVEGSFRGDHYYKNTINYSSRHEGYIYVGAEADNVTFKNAGWRNIGLIGTGHLTSIEENHTLVGVLTDPEPYEVTGKFGINQDSPLAALHVGSGNAIIVGTTDITSDTNIGGNLDVTGFGNFGDTLTVSGDTELLSDLDVHGNVTISGNTLMGGDLTINGGDIYSNASSFTILDTSSTITFGSSATLITVGTNSGKMVVENPLTEFNGNLQIDGITTSGVTKAEVSTDATEFTFLSNVNAANILNVDAFAGAQNITVGKTGKGSTTVNHDLIVKGDFQVQGQVIATDVVTNQHAASIMSIGTGATFDYVTYSGVTDSNGAVTSGVTYDINRGTTTYSGVTISGASRDLHGGVTFTSATVSGTYRGTLTYNNYTWDPSTKTVVIVGDWSNKNLHFQAGPLDTWAQDGTDQDGNTLATSDYTQIRNYNIEDLYWDYGTLNGTGERFNGLGGTKSYNATSNKTTITYSSTKLDSKVHTGYYLNIREVESVYGEDLTHDDGQNRAYKVHYFADELSQGRQASLMFDHGPSTVADRVWRLYNDAPAGKFSDLEAPNIMGRLRLDEILADRYTLQVDPFENFNDNDHEWNSNHGEYDIISFNMAKAIRSVALRQGAIIMWSGSISGSSMPRGYAPCDGQKYRCADGVERTVPDLRGRFAVGAGYSSSDRVAASVGGTGGSMGGSLTAELGGHCLSKHEIPPHTHGLNFEYFKHTHPLLNTSHTHTVYNQLGGANGPYGEGGETRTTDSTQTGGPNSDWALSMDYPVYSDGTTQPGPAGQLNVAGTNKTNRSGPGNGGTDSTGNQGNYHAHAMSPNSDDRRREYNGQSLGNVASNSLGRGTGSGIAHAHHHGIKLSISGSSSGEAPTEGGKHPSSTGGSNPYGSATVSLPTTPPYYALYYIYKL